MGTPGISVVQNTETDQLLKSLAISNKELSDTGDKVLKEERQDQLKQGQMAREQSQKDWADAVDAGTVPQAANPWFIKGYQQQDGRVAGLNYYTEMRAAYATSAAKGSDDPKVYQQFVADFTKSYMEKTGAGKSTDWMDGFKITSESAQAQLNSEHASQAEQAVIAKQAANTGAEINVILNTSKDPKVAADAINALGDKMKLNGMPPAEFEKVAAEAVLAKAKLGNGNYLQALDYIKSGDGKGTLANNPKVATAKVDTQQWLTEKARGDTRWAWAQEDRQWSIQQRQYALQQHQMAKEEYEHKKMEWDRVDQTRSLQSQILLRTMSDPAGAVNNNKDDLSSLAKINPTAAENSAGFIDSWLTKRERIPDDVERPVLAQLQADIIGSAGNPMRQQQLMDQATRLFRDGKLNKETMMRVLDDARQIASFDPGVQRKLQSATVVEVKKAAENYFAQDAKYGAVGPYSLDALYAKQVIDRKVLDTVKANPNITEEQLGEAASQALRGHLSAIGALTPGSSGKTEELGGKAAVGNARTQGLIVGAPPAANGPAPKAELVIDSVAPADQAAALRRFNEAYQQGPAAFSKSLADFDARVGVPGLGRLILERGAAPPEQPKKK